jgi:hypothetical protein
MGSKGFLLQINKIRRWSFLFRGMGVTDVEIDPKISSEKASEKILYRARNFKET